MLDATAEFDDLKPMRLTAHEFIKVMERGDSRPLAVNCYDDSGEEVSVVLKLRDPQRPDGRPWNVCLVHDLVGTILARRLGLSVPRYALVEIDDRFVMSQAVSPEGARIQANRGLNFGSVVVSPVLEQLGAHPEHWEPVMSFDALTFNCDRKGGNPNVLWTGKALFAIDHGMIAPVWTFMHDGTDGTSLYPDDQVRSHAGFKTLCNRARSYVLTEQWSTLVTQSFLGWLRRQVPSTWAPAPAIDALFDFISARQAIALRQQSLLKGVIK